MIAFAPPETSCARRNLSTRWLSRFFHEVRGDFAEVRSRSLRLVAELHAQFEASAKLEQAIKAKLRGLGYGR